MQILQSRLTNSARCVKELCLLPTLMFCTAMSLASCGTKEEPAPERQTDTTSVAENVLTEQKVEGWYNLYIDGKYDEYVKLIEAVDGKPAGYADQMVNLLKMRHRQQEDLHNGPKKCRVVRIEMKSDSYCEAYVELTFKDDAKEQFILPLVKVSDRWRIK